MKLPAPSHAGSSSTPEFTKIKPITPAEVARITWDRLPTVAMSAPNLEPKPLFEIIGGAHDRR